MGRNDLAAHPERNDRFDAPHQVAGPMAQRCDALQCVEIGYAGYQCALAAAVVQDLCLGIVRIDRGGFSVHQISPCLAGD